MAKSNRSSKLIRTLLSLIKEKSSLLKSSALSLLLHHRPTSSVHLTILLATANFPPSPPPSHRLAAVIFVGDSAPQPTAAATVAAIIDRLHRTSSAHVALKCLIVVRHVLAHGSFILRDQLCFYPANGGSNFLNLVNFHDGADNETWELSKWVRFYSCYLETNLLACRKLGVFISSHKPANKIGDYEVGLSNLSNFELMREIEVLVGLIEEICRAPNSVFDSKSSLIYEILMLISEDYGSIQRLVQDRLGEFRDRIAELARDELDKLVGLGRRVEECRESISEVFGNKKRNDAFWEFVGETASEFTRFRGRVGKPSLLVWVERVNGTAGRGMTLVKV